MITVKGYSEVDYYTLTGILYDAYKRSGKTFFQLAGEIKVNSTQTPANAFRSDRQVVSDDILTSVMLQIGVKGFVVWIYGQKYYYIKNGK